jgi:signal transduction histidine kinase
MSDLRPSVLNDLGLVAAIEWLVHDFEEHAGIQCIVNADVGEPEVPDEVAIALFRIAQEALTNVAKHARAATATVSLHLDANRLVLEISDDGIGIASDWNSKKGSFGLIGMRERAIAIGGELHVLSGLKSGGRIRVEVPLVSQAPESAAA